MSAFYQMRTDSASQLIKLYAEAAMLYRRALRAGEDITTTKAVFFHMRQVIAACFLGDADLDDLDEDLGVEDELLAFYLPHKVNQVSEV